MSSFSPKNPSPQALQPTRRQLLTSWLTGLGEPRIVGNFILARALDALDLAQLEHLVDEVEQTFFGSEPDWRALDSQKLRGDK